MPPVGDEEHRAVGVVQDALTDGAQEHAAEAAVAPGAHDQTEGVLSGPAQFLDRASFDHLMGRGCARRTRRAGSRRAVPPRRTRSPWRQPSRRCHPRRRRSTAVVESCARPRAGRRPGMPTARSAAVRQGRRRTVHVRLPTAVNRLPQGWRRAAAPPEPMRGPLGQQRGASARARRSASSASAPA